MADDGEFVDAQRVRQQEDVAHDLVGRVAVHAFGLGRAAIAALVGGDAAVAVLEMGDLVAPGPVAFGKAVKEDEHRRIARAGVDGVELDAVGERDAGLGPVHQSSACIFSM